MARTVNSEIVFLLLLFLILPVPAAENATDLSTTAPVPAVSPAPCTIRLFIPTRDMVHSDQINDLVSGRNGSTIIATSFGLSEYNGSWSTRHRNLDNISQGLMDDYVTAVEFDADGNLWIGYSGGLQIYDGVSYRTIRDQQLLKETRIKDLQRWDDSLWVATGHAGIHRYRNGTWTWYQPMTRHGPGFYEVRSMALDANNRVMVIVTDMEGIWTLQLADDRPVFSAIAYRNATYGLFDRARRDPRGGVYLSNSTMVARYTPQEGIVPVLMAGDLSPGEIAINDLAAAPDGRIFIASDNGMYIWKDGSILSHLGRFEGMGASPVVRTVAMDAQNRVWFSSTGYVGFCQDLAAGPTIAVDLVHPAATTPPPVTTPPPTAVPVPVVTSTGNEPFFAPGSPLAFLNPVIDPVIKAIRAAGARG